jgi:hypothetical protein
VRASAAFVDRRTHEACADDLMIFHMKAIMNMLPKADLVFQDGTSLDKLIDLDANEVSLRVMTDPELYRI